MSNFLYNGFEFKELNSKFQLQNISPIFIGETGQMRLPLLNNQNSGYVLNTSTPYSTNPDFLLEKQTDTNIITLIKYDGTNDIFQFNKKIDLQNIAKITNSLDPVNPQDLVTKSFLQSSIAGFGPGTVTFIGLTTNTNGLSILNSPITQSGNINISLSNNLQAFNTLGYGTNGQVLGINGGAYSWITPTLGTVTSIGLTTNTNGLSILNSPITQSGNINISLSNNLQAFNTLGYGTNGQVLGINGGAYSWITPTLGTVTSIGLTTNTNGLSISNSPITQSGNINISLSNNLQAFNTLGYGTNGQVLGINGGVYSWITPASGGNVTGSSSTTVNALALWNNTFGTSLGSTNITLDVSGNLNLNSKRIVAAQDPVSAQDYATKNYIDTLIHDIIRTGNVFVGDIGGTSGIVNLGVSGNILSATKQNAYNSTSDSFIDINYADKGYIPTIFVFTQNAIFNSNANDISVPIIQSNTNTTARIYLEETNASLQNLILNVLLIKFW